MADGAFTVEVVTPERSLVSGPARALMARSSVGDYTVLAGHTTVVTDIVPGEARVEEVDGTVVRLAVHGGFLQVQTGRDVPAAPSDQDRADQDLVNTRATLLAAVAERAQDIDVERAERARAEAQERITQLEGGAGARGAEPVAGAEGGPTPADVELVEAKSALRRAEVRLAVAGAPAVAS